MKKIILIKIGGSLITDKNKPFTLKSNVLKTIAKEVKRAFSLKDNLLVLGHGAGSFAHLPAGKHKTIKGIKNKNDLFGMAKVCQAACQLNRIVVKKLLQNKLPAVSVSPISCFLSENFKPQKLFTGPVEQLLRLNALPVVYGDVILDNKKGCTIFSTEKILHYIGRQLAKTGFKVEKIIHCGQTNGVYDENGKTIKLITNKNFSKFEKVLGKSAGFDVTGGMLHKVKESLQIAKNGIPALIIDGIEKGTLFEAVLGKDVLGTKIEWE